MNKASLFLSSLYIVVVLFASCKRTYQCTCPTMRMNPQPYVFEVKASSSGTARQACIDAVKAGKLVYKPDVDECRIYSPQVK